MRVGLLTGSVSRDGGGGREVVLELSRVLQRSGDVRPYVFGTRDRHTDADRADWSPVPITACPVIGPRRLSFSPALRSAVLHAPLDVLHVHGLWMHGSAIALAWQRRTGGPRVVSPHGMLDPWALRGRWAKAAALRTYEGAHLRRAACIHALNAAELDCIRALGIRTPVCVVANGVAPPAAGSLPRPSWTNFLPSDARVLLHLGRIHPKKGLAGLLQALAIVKRRGLLGPWRLVIAGWDQKDHAAELQAIADGLNLMDRVLIVGPQFGADRDATYRAADAFVLPSFSEGLPMAVLEAWANGLPALLTEHCNLAEGFAAGAAIRIDTAPEVMACQIAGFFALDDARLAEIGARARRLAADRFSWEQRAAEMASVYRWLLGRAAKPPCVEEWPAGQPAVGALSPDRRSHA